MQGIHENYPMIFQSVLACLFYIAAFLAAYVAKRRKIVVCMDYGDAFFQTAAISACLFSAVFFIYLAYGGKEGYVSYNMETSSLQNLITALFILYNFYIAFIYHRGNWKRIAFAAVVRVVFVVTLSTVLLLIPVMAFNIINTKLAILRGLNIRPDNGFILSCLAISAAALAFMALLAWLLSRFAYIKKFSNPFKYAVPAKIKEIGLRIRNEKDMLI